ncbi:hypothetical protein BC826DRAFT_1033712 [Russula brevipes]|nr:hypothetical protein BC826DRAFT_1033712 [Russula brevipes]
MCLELANWSNSDGPGLLDSHVEALKGILSNGHQIATGASDNTIWIWGIHSLKALYAILVHLSNVPVSLCQSCISSVLMAPCPLSKSRRRCHCCTFLAHI